MNKNIQRQQQFLGFLYGLVAGIAFALTAWGVDAWLLAQANSTFPAVKIIPGLIISALAGGVAGWLTMRYENHLLGMLVWGLLAVLLSWLVVWLPLTGAPALIQTLDPSLASWFDFAVIDDLYQFHIVSLIIVGLAAIISGILEINLIEQAMLSSYPSAPVTAMLVCLILFAIAGSAMDHMINTNFREPLQVVDELIQFAADHAGEDVPVTTARKMHLSSVKLIEGLVQKPRHITLITIDAGLGLMNLLVDFEGTWAKCTTIYAQPTDCIPITGVP